MSRPSNRRVPKPPPEVPIEKRCLFCDDEATGEVVLFFLSPACPYGRSWLKGTYRACAAHVEWFANQVGGGTSWRSA